MLGAIIGDMVGSPYEFHPWQGAAEAFPLFSPCSRFTDDTVMTVAVARGRKMAAAVAKAPLMPSGWSCVTEALRAA